MFRKRWFTAGSAFPERGKTAVSETFRAVNCRENLSKKVWTVGLNAEIVSPCSKTIYAS